MDVAKQFIRLGNSAQEVLSFAGLSRSTWHYKINDKLSDSRYLNKGRTLTNYCFYRHG